MLPLSDAGLAQAVAWHRQVAAMVEAADRAGVAIDDLPALRARLAALTGLFTQAASRIGAPLPALVPSPAEIAAAGASLGDLSPDTVTAAARTMQTTLSAVESALGAARTDAAGTPEPTPGARIVPTQQGAAAPAAKPAGAFSELGDLARSTPALRNGAIYAAYALPVLGVQIFVTLLLVDRSFWIVILLGLLVLPVLAFSSAWLTIGALFPAPAGEKSKRSPRLGFAICNIPNLVMCGWVVTNFFG